MPSSWLALVCQINGGGGGGGRWKRVSGSGGLVNEVGRKFPGYLISGVVLINKGNEKLKNCIFIINVKKQM